MEFITSRQIAPFQALLNMVKINYESKPEVFRILIAILYDYKIDDEESIKMTKRYINILLSENTDLAEFLVTFLPEPTEIVQPKIVHSKVMLHTSQDVVTVNEEENGNSDKFPHGNLISQHLQQTQNHSTGITTIPCSCQECTPFGGVWPNGGPQAFHSTHLPNTEPMVEEKPQTTADPKFMKPIFRFTNKATIPFSPNPAFQGYPIHCSVIPAVFNNQAIGPVDEGMPRGKAPEFGIHDNRNTIAPVSVNLVPGINSVTNPRASNTIVSTSTNYPSKRRSQTPTIAAQLSKPAINSINQQYLANIPPFAHTSISPSTESSVEESRPQKRITEAMLEAPPPASKMPKLRNKSVREMESLKALTSKLKLACAEKKLETMKLALSCAEKRLESKQKKSIEESRVEANKISQEYATLFHTASNLTTDHQGSVRLTVSGIPFQIRDPKTQTMVQATARNLTSFPYIQKISIPGGETHNVNI